MNLNITPNTPYEVVDHVKGFTEEALEAMLTEAEEGYEIDPAARQEGPASMLDDLPQEVRAAIIQICLETGNSPNEIIKNIVVEHFHQTRAA